MIHVLSFHRTSSSSEMSSDSFKVKLHSGERIWTWDADMNMYKLNKYREGVLSPISITNKLQILIGKPCSPCSVPGSSVFYWGSCLFSEMGYLVLKPEVTFHPNPILLCSGWTVLPDASKSKASTAGRWILVFFPLIFLMACNHIESGDCSAEHGLLWKKF